MTFLNPRDDQALDEIATEWLCEREEGFTPERKRAFIAWCESDPRHAAAVRRVEDTLKLLDELPSVRDVLEERLRPEGVALSSARQRPPVARSWAWGAGLAAALVFGVLVWRNFPSSAAAPTKQYTTDLNVQESVALADGSVMDVNAGSEVAVQFTPAERRVTLRRGEAHFQVAHNANRPFTVTAGGVTVRAVGTAFEVQLRDDAVNVVVVEGKVALDRRQETAAPSRPTSLVVAGERAQVALGRADVPPRIDIIDPKEMRSLLTWSAPMASFTEVPLHDVVIRLNRHNPVELVLADAELGARKIGGRFGLDQVEAFVRLLEQDGDIVADRTTPGRITLRRAR